MSASRPPRALSSTADDDDDYDVKQKEHLCAFPNQMFTHVGASSSCSSLKRQARLLDVSRPGKSLSHGKPLLARASRFVALVFLSNPLISQSAGRVRRTSANSPFLSFERTQAGGGESKAESRKVEVLKVFVVLIRPAVVLRLPILANTPRLADIVLILLRSRKQTL